MHNDLSSEGQACIADVMFCYGTQTMDNSRTCHCLLFHEHGKQKILCAYWDKSKIICATWRSAPNNEGWMLTTPLKVWHHWWLRVQQLRIAWCSWPIRTGLRGAFQAAMKWRMADMCIRYFLKNGRRSNQGKRILWLSRKSRMVNGDGKWFNQFCETQFHVWCFYSPFHISSALLIGYLQSDSHWLFAKWSLFVHTTFSLAQICPLVEYFASLIRIFHLIRAVCFLSRV